MSEVYWVLSSRTQCPSIIVNPNPDSNAIIPLFLVFIVLINPFFITSST